MRAFALLLALLPSLALAQTATIAGRVTDAETGTGLPGANVFLSGTVRGAAADADGRFAFSTDVLGDGELVASLVGYGLATERVTLQPSDSLWIELALDPAEVALGEVQVEGRQSRQWRADLRRFTSMFLGVSPNGRRAELENPEILDFTRDGDRLLARARAPLVVRNEALGYRMTLLDLQFEAANGAWGWKSPLRYEDLPSASSRRVRRARTRTYRGSLRHFLTALVAGTVDDEGFEVRPVQRPGNLLRSRPLDPGALARLVTADTAGASWTVVSALPLQVNYEREKDPRPGHRGEDQISWITIDNLSVRVDSQGRLLEPRPITRYGYWDWERTADLLPSDYVPDE